MQYSTGWKGILQTLYRMLACAIRKVWIGLFAVSIAVIACLAISIFLCAAFLDWAYCKVRGREFHMVECVEV